jgi:hypothetical protein
VQAARAAHLLQLPLELHDALADQAAVDLDLRFAGAAEEAEAAALPLQVGPGPHEPRALVIQMRELDLQRAFAGAGAVAEDLQDQAGPVDDLGLPGALQVALLHGREMAVDHHQFDLEVLHQATEALDRALAQQRRGVGPGHGHALGITDVEIDRGGEAAGLIQPCAVVIVVMGSIAARLIGMGAAFQARMNDECGGRCLGGF